MMMMKPCHLASLWLLTLTLSISLPQSSGRRRCGEVLEDPQSVFSQSKSHTEPLAEYSVVDLATCIDVCCYDETSCNVGVYTEDSATDSNCWLYACDSLDSCSIKIRKGSQVFVDPQSTEADNTQTSAYTDRPTDAYDDYKVGSDKSGGYTTDAATYYDNEESGKEETSDTFPRPESTTNTSPFTTSDSSTVTSLESVSDTTSSVTALSENSTFESLVNESGFQNDTFIIPGNEDGLKNDTFLLSLNKDVWENNTSVSNVTEEVNGNNTFASPFTEENDTDHENDTVTALVVYNGENDTFLTGDQVANNDSSSSLSPPEVESPQTPFTSVETYYNVQPSVTSWSENTTLLQPTHTTPNSDVLTETPVFSSSDWPTNLASTSEQVKSTSLLALVDLGSSVALESLMVTDTNDADSWSLGMVVESTTLWPASTQVTEQSATVTPEMFPPGVLPSDYDNGMESRANMAAQPSQTFNALLISALTIGCVCTLAVVGVLSLRLYDGYKKRHYSRLDYLINGIYN